MTTPLISLCIPTFDRARYLDSLLHSLAAELATFAHAFEIVVSDNACTDDTPDCLLYTSDAADE